MPLTRVEDRKLMAYPLTEESLRDAPGWEAPVVLELLPVLGGALPHSDLAKEDRAAGFENELAPVRRVRNQFDRWGQGVAGGQAQLPPVGVLRPWAGSR